MGNELKLSLENFQSISRGELIFHTGTNVIIGQSNSGKTATFRALKACLSNPKGSQRFIKKGTNKSSVALEYNGNQIIWKRTAKESSYTINGEDFIKTGSSSAFKIIEDTGFVLDDDVIMNIEEELQLPFPFGIPKSELFKLYENVFCVSDSAVILKAAKEKEEETKNQISTLENEIVKNQNKLAEIKVFKEEIDLAYLGNRKEYFKEAKEKIEFLKEGIGLIHRAAKVEDFYIDEKCFENKYISLQGNLELKHEISKIKKLHNLGKELKEVKEPEVKDLGIYEDLKDLKRTCKILEDLKKLQISEKDFTNKLQEYKELREYSFALRNLREKIKAKKEKLKEIEELINNAEGELKQFKICPLCHQPINN